MQTRDPSKEEMQVRRDIELQYIVDGLSVESNTNQAQATQTTDTSNLKRQCRIHGVEGFRYAAHVWVLGFHCMPHPEGLDRLKRNGDSGVFFLLTGMATEMALYFLRGQRWEREIDHSGTQRGEELSSRLRLQWRRAWWFSLYWFRSRILKIAVMSFIVAAISYLIFPIPGGQGRYLMPYILTFTVSLRERFSHDRIVWNPNPVMWFCSELILFWILHPLLLSRLVKKCAGDKPRSILEFGGVLYVSLILACVIIEPFAVAHSGWSFHPLPRLLQYICGIYVARFVICSQSTPAESGGWMLGCPHTLHRLRDRKGLLYYLLLFLPDLSYVAQIIYWSGGPQRYAPEWKKLWVWKSIGATPIQMACLLGLSLQRDLADLLSPLSQLSASNFDSMQEQTPTGLSCNLSSTPIHTKIATSTHDTDFCMGDPDLGSIARSRSTRIPLGKSNTWSPDTAPRDRIHSRESYSLSGFMLCLWRIAISKSLVYRLFTQNWTERVAPGMVNYLVFLLHFPLSWQFDRNKVISGAHSIAYCFSLWFVCITIDSIMSRKMLCVSRPAQ